MSTRYLLGDRYTTAHNQTAHTVAACTWGLNSALNQYKETQP